MSGGRRALYHACEDVCDVVKVCNHTANTHVVAEYHAEIQRTSHNVVQQHLVEITLSLSEEQLIYRVSEMVAKRSNRVNKHRPWTFKVRLLIGSNRHFGGFPKWFITTDLPRQPASWLQHHIAPDCRDKEVLHLPKCPASFVCVKLFQLLIAIPLCVLGEEIVR